MHFTTATILTFLTEAIMAIPCQQYNQLPLKERINITSSTDPYYDYYRANMNGGLYVCENIRFTGYCFHYTEPFGQCTTLLDKFPPGDRSVSSVGADQGSWCTLYSEENCHGQELQVHFPGFEDLTYLGWNDMAKSFNCAAE